MKKLNAFLVSVLSAMALNAAVIEQVIVRQQWPWSTDVKVEYKLGGVTEPVDLTVKAFNGNVELPLPDAAIRGKRYGIREDGIGQLVIDPVAAFGTEKIALANFRVKLSAGPTDEAMNEVVYKIFDLTNGHVEDVTRGALLNGEWGAYETDYGKIGPGYKTELEDVIIWTGVTNNPVYKDEKLVLRRIPKGKTKVFMTIGKIPDEPNWEHPYDYYIGVFELTQEQVARVSTENRNGCRFTGQKYLPEDTVGDYWAYGTASIRYATPDNTRTSFFTGLRDKFNGVYDFEAPTCIMWLRAMRAGAMTFYHDGVGTPANFVSNAQYDAIARYSENGGIDGTVENGTRPVGLGRPNAYGLYDMLGNVWEYSRWYTDWGMDTWGVHRGGVDTMIPVVTPPSIRTYGFGYSWRENAGGKDTVEWQKVFDTRYSSADYKFDNLGVRVSCMLMSDVTAAQAAAAAAQ